MHTARNDEIWTCEVVTFDLDTVSGIYVHKIEEKKDFLQDFDF